jgi:hypothetical protein
MEGVLVVSKEAGLEVEEKSKYSFVSHERNTGQDHDLNVATISFSECEKCKYL